MSGGPPLVRPLDWSFSPEHAFEAWPTERPLAALWSASPARPPAGTPSPWSRWTILAQPTGTLTLSQDAAGRPRSTWDSDTSRGPQGGHFTDCLSHRPLDDLDLAIASTRRAGLGAASEIPFVGGWIGLLSYQLGRIIEPAAAHRAGPHDDRAWPLAQWHRCPAAFVHDNATGRWCAVGDEDDVVALPDLSRGAPSAAADFELGDLASRTGREAYEASVARTVRLIRDGDLFQANLAHRLTGPFSGSARSLFLELARAARPWYGAYIESPTDPASADRRILASISPELFLQADMACSKSGGEGGGRERRVVSRPIKGTRPAGMSPDDLRESPKDQAELNMIVDLMRNDLGRVCEYGSVRVDDPRAIEQHGGPAGDGVLHGVATISGKLRPEVTLGGLLSAAFAPGSVTGAPKIRAMQVIEELEPVSRGPYCGAIGFASDCGRAALNVTIRTAAISGRAPAGSRRFDDIAEGVLDYSVGAGIVADSIPESEWTETMDKAAAIRSLAGPVGSRR